MCIVYRHYICLIRPLRLAFSHDYCWEVGFLRMFLIMQTLVVVSQAVLICTADRQTDRDFVLCVMSF